MGEGLSDIALMRAVNARTVSVKRGVLKSIVTLNPDKPGQNPDKTGQVTRGFSYFTKQPFAAPPLLSYTTCMYNAISHNLKR